MPAEFTDRQLELMAACLDGEAAAEEIAELEQELERDPGLRRRYESLAGMERELREAFPARARPAPARPGALRQFLTAAALILAVCGAWWFGQGRTNPINPLSGASVHAGFVSDPEPDIVCDTPEKFLAYTREKLGVPIAADFSSDLLFVGWRGLNGAYKGQPGETTDPRVLMLRNADGVPVVVLFQPSADPRPTLDERGDLKRFKKRFGPVTAWEVSPLDRPVALPRLSRG